MINSHPAPEEPGTPEKSSVGEILKSGPRGALTVAAIAALVVAVLWFLFYLFVFLPRGPFNDLGIGARS